MTTSDCLPTRGVHVVNQPADWSSQIDGAHFRTVLGHFATGVVVVTAQTDDGPVGITCQSFSSLSLDPPLVLFCVTKSSYAWARIRAAGHFCVNILDEDQEGLGLVFAGRTQDKFAGLAYDVSRTGAPVLPGVSGWIDCELHAVHDGGDHDVVLGRVVDLGMEPDRRPLVFYRGGFGRFTS